VHASIRRIPLALSGSSAWPSGGSARPLRLVLSSGSHRRDAAPGIGFDLVPRSPLNSVQSPQEAELMHHNGPSISGAHRRIKSANFADLVSGLKRLRSAPRAACRPIAARCASNRPTSSGGGGVAAALSRIGQS
jgi:hypothetical protein